MLSTSLIQQAGRFITIDTVLNRWDQQMALIATAFTIAVNEALA